MSSTNDSNRKEPAKSDGLLSQQIDATIGFVGSSDDKTRRATSNVTKQDRDLAFASTLLRSGWFTERQLASAVNDWTTHGSQTLAEHVVARQFITEEQRQQIETSSLREIDRVEKEITRNADWSRAQKDRLWLNRLDRGGRIAKLLGIADASVLTTDEVELRQVGARYTLLRRLGQGGIGTVWLARDENLQRYVALKEVTGRTQPGDPALAHFRREAEITGQLEHPGIVPVYQFGTDEKSGRSFYAMRFLGKRTLQDAISEYHERRQAGNEDTLLQHRLLTAFVNVCQAVAHAHSRKIIHRDLKPENIAIDSFGQIVLLDWGLAKINEETGMYEVNGQAEPGDLHSIGSTHSGRVLGTPLYMAPEQAAGRLDEVDELTDVYGLGGILYAILTGEAPHLRGIESGDLKGDSSAVFSKIVASAITPPREVVDDVPPELDAVCMKALANKRYLRYASATELAEEIERYRAGSPVTSYQAPVKRRITRWMAEHPTLAQLVLLLTTLTLIGGAAIGFTARRGRLALQEARHEQLRDFVRELDLNLQFETQELVQDIRFVTDFPLTRVIVASQNPETIPDGTLKEGESVIDVMDTTPEEWLERQGRLLDGLLNANPEYLVATNVKFQKPNMTELVRTERLKAGMRPRRVPTGQLYTGEHPETDNDLYSLRPGEVVLTTADKLAEKVPTKNRTSLVLIAVCPIFDETGDFFGINAIELDLKQRLEDLFSSLDHDDVDVYVTDESGGIVLAYINGHSTHYVERQDATKQFPKLQSLFSPTGGSGEYSEDRSIFAVKVRLGGDTSNAYLGIIATLQPDSDK